MLTYATDDFKSFSQKFYDNCISKINLFDTHCTCGHKGSLIKHGYYSRKVKTNDGISIIKILRVKCSICGKTHSILLSSIVPYSQVSLHDQVAIVNGNSQEVMNSIPDIDESTCSRIRKHFHSFFFEFLKSEKLKLSSLSVVILSCLSKLKIQFMQMKKSVTLSSGQIILLDNILIS